MIALDAFTPVDVSVSESLTPAARARHGFDLTRRLAVAAELSQHGAGQVVTQTLSSSLADQELLVALDSLVEFGRLPGELDAVRREQASRSQIRDEILHFDRIMDLDALRDGRDLKRRRDQIWDTGPHAATERMLTLTYERRVLRGDEKPEWLNIGAAQPGVVQQTAAGATLVRGAYPELVAVAAGARAVDCLRRLAAYCGKHPLGVAVGMVDYELAMGDEAPCALIAATAAVWFQHRTVKIWACGSGIAFSASRQGYRHQVGDYIRLSGTPLGSVTPSFARAEIRADADSRIIIALGDHERDPDALSAELSTANRRGRIYLHENLTRLFGAGQFAKLTPKSVEHPQDLTRTIVDDFLSSAVDNHHGPCTFSIEIGHVHADRELGPTQRRGIVLGLQVIDAISNANRARPANRQIVFEVVPMIDDDHVVNRISYDGFQLTLQEYGVQADEIVLESSPLILDLACDLIATALTGAGNSYLIQRHGRNLYLESGDHRIELIEDADDEMRVGCIVFDAALTIYRTARSAMQTVFAQRTGYSGDIHQDMLRDYDETTDPYQRRAIRHGLAELWKRPLTELKASSATPYLDAYRAAVERRREVDHKVVILNVLEDYYEPLELKVNQFGRLLGLELNLNCLLFSPYGSGLRILGS